MNKIYISVLVVVLMAGAVVGIGKYISIKSLVGEITNNTDLKLEINSDKDIPPSMVPPPIYRDPNLIVPSVIPIPPNPIQDGFILKNIYINDEYGFSIKYPDGLVATTSGYSYSIIKGTIVDFVYSFPRETHQESCRFVKTIIKPKNDKELVEIVSNPNNEFYFNGGSDSHSEFSASSITPISVGEIKGVLIIVPNDFAYSFHYFFNTPKGVIDLRGSIFSKENKSLCHAMLSSLKKI